MKRNTNVHKYTPVTFGFLCLYSSEKSESIIILNKKMWMLSLIRALPGAVQCRRRRSEGPREKSKGPKKGRKGREKEKRESDML